MTILSFLVSALFSTVWIGSLYYDFKYQPRLGHDWYIYKLIMLTNLDFVLLTIYSIIVLLSYTRIKKIGRLADFMFFTSVFPVAIITCALFWGLYAIEPNLVMPDWVAKLIPSWLNHVTHTFPVAYVLVDSFLHRRTAPTSRSALRVSSILVLVYFGIIFGVKFLEGYWLYPLLELFSIIHFCLAYVVGVIGFFVLTQLARCVNSRMNVDSSRLKRHAKKL